MKQILRSFALALSLSVGLVGLGMSAASACQSKAASIAASKGGRVLSVESRGANCKIRLLVPDPPNPPKRITVTVRK